MTSKVREEKHDTLPDGSAPAEELGPDPEPAPARPDGYRYERPRLDDSMSVRLLDGLNAERFPRSTTIAQTDGQLAAHYQVGPRAAPPAVPTPPPEPSVLVRTSVNVPIVVPASRIPHPVDSDATLAMSLPVHRPRWLLVGVMMSAMAVLGALALVMAHRRGAPSPAERASVAAQSAALPAVDVATVPFVEIAPLTVPSTLPAPTAESPAPPAKAAAAPLWRAAPSRSLLPAQALPPVRHAPTSKEPDVPLSSKIDKSDRE